MTFSYLSSGPGSSDRSWVRLMVGDNTTTPANELEDEDIDVLLSDHGSKERAAIAAARALGAKYARKSDKTVGRLSISASQISKNYYELAKELERNLSRTVGGTALYAGGISQSDKDSEEDDTDRVAPAFTRGQFDVVGLNSTGDQW